MIEKQEPDPEWRDLAGTFTDQISKGTGTWSERFWCRLKGGHQPGEMMPAWYPGGPGHICQRCGKVPV